MSGWLNDGNFTVVATRAWSRRDLGEKMAPIGGAQLAVTVTQETVTGWLMHELGRGDAVLGRRGEKTAREDFPIFKFPFPF
jgi:hypothetical protein